MKADDKINFMNNQFEYFIKIAIIVMIGIYSTLMFSYIRAKLSGNDCMKRL